MSFRARRVGARSPAECAGALWAASGRRKSRFGWVRRSPLRTSNHSRRVRSEHGRFFALPLLPPFLSETGLQLPLDGTKSAGGNVSGVCRDDCCARAATPQLVRSLPTPNEFTAFASENPDQLSRCHEYILGRCRIFVNCNLTFFEDRKIESGSCALV